jgi:hypothetical protein
MVFINTTEGVEAADAFSKEFKSMPDEATRLGTKLEFSDAVFKTTVFPLFPLKIQEPTNPDVIETKTIATQFLTFIIPKLHHFIFSAQKNR